MDNLDIEEDKFLNGIKIICFSYLDSDATLYEVDKDLLYEYMEFLTDKYKQYKAVKDGFQIMGASNDIINTSSILDTITLHGTDYVNGTKAIDQLSKDIRKTVESISFCYGIVNKMLQYREAIDAKMAYDADIQYEEERHDNQDRV